MNDLTKNVLVFVVIIVVLLSVVQGLSTVNTGQPQPVDYSDFLSRVQSGSVNIVEFSEDKTQIQFGDRKPFPYYTVNPETDTGPLVDLRRTVFRELGPRPGQGQFLITRHGILVAVVVVSTTVAPWCFDGGDTMEQAGCQVVDHLFKRLDQRRFVKASFDRNGQFGAVLKIVNRPTVKFTSANG